MERVLDWLNGEADTQGAIDPKIVHAWTEPRT